MSFFRTTSIHPLANTAGSSVIYTNVCEESEDGSRTEYTFSGLQGNTDGLSTIGSINGLSPTPFDKFSDRSYRRGKILSKTDYDASGRKVASSTFQYNTSSMESDKTYACSLTLQKNYRSGQTLDIYEETMTEGLYYMAGRLYCLFADRYDISCQTDSLFYPDGTFLVSKKSYDYQDNAITITSPYSHQIRARTLKSVNESRGGSSIKKTFVYPFESSNKLTRSLTEKSNLIIPVSTSTFYGNTFNRKDSTVFSDFTLDMINKKPVKHVMPLLELVDYGNCTDTTVTYIKYTKTGALLQYRRLGEEKTTLKWAHNDNYLVYSQVGIHPYDQTFKDNDVFVYSDNLVDVLKARIVSCKPDFIIGYSYFGNVGFSTTVSANGITNYYRYNNRNQLVKVLDNSRAVINSYEYNYRK